MTRILVTGAFRLPDGDAAAFRVLALGELLRSRGCDVTLAGWESAGEREPMYLHDGFPCHPQGEFRETQVGMIRRVSGFLWRGSNTLRWLRRQPAFDGIIAYNPPAWFLTQLLDARNSRGASLALDSTEWYESAHLPGGRFGLAAFENWCRMRVVYPRVHNVICVSSYLSQYFAGRNVVWIPPLQPTATSFVATAPRPPIADGVRFLYAGQAGRKDRLLRLATLLPSLGSVPGTSPSLTIAGMTWIEFEQHCTRAGVAAAGLKDYVRCLGRVSRQTVQALYQVSHVSLLFRENKRYAVAGFPTKAMESWSAGCVILGNPVGDFGRLATDGVDALLCDEAVLEHRLRPMLASIQVPGRFETMAAACVATADRLFSQRRYETAADQFLARMKVAACGGSHVSSLQA